MKIPEAPPDFNTLLDKSMQLVVTFIGSSQPVDNKGHYLHWEETKYKEPPNDLSREQWWLTMKMPRLQLYKPAPFFDKSGNEFRYASQLDLLQEKLHWLTKYCAGNVSGDSQLINPETRDKSLIRSLYNEAITSSQLEGASTTRKVAKEMLQKGRAPHDINEQMIYNNYLAMQFIRENVDQTLTPGLIFQLHKIITDKTLDDSSWAGQLRNGDDVQVYDGRDGTLLHTPPLAAELPDRLDKLCHFANDEDPGNFVHPVIRAIILHFIIGYDHPFEDGNGRTARALFYWSMVRQGYWITEFISISEVIKEAPAQYSRAFLYTETDNNDMTYFIIHQVGVIKKAIDRLHEYLDRKENEIEETEKLLDRNRRLRRELNHRQMSLVKHAQQHPGYTYTIEEHKNSHGVTYQTARTDLLTMSEKFGLFDKKKAGRTFLFVSPHDLLDRIETAI